MIDEKIFPFLAEKGHVISLVGGGGKTTLMYNLAAHCAHKGWRVLAATTTHIMQPPGGGLGTDGCRAFPPVEVRQLCRGRNRCTRRQIDGPAAGTAGALDGPCRYRAH